MRNAGNKKLRLVLLALALLSLSVVALGGTFANQVIYDELKGDFSENSTLDYKVDVKYYDSAKQSYTEDLLTSSVFDSTLWCPGYTKIVYLKITNNEAFPVDCTLNMTVNETGFDDTLRYAIINENLKAEDAEHPKNWKDFAVDNSFLLSKTTHTLIDKKTFGNNDSQYYALAIHMDENATNQYQNQKLDMTFNFSVNANYKTGETPAPITPK